MAKKINVKLILELRDAGMSRNAIASTRHMSKNSVGDVIHIADRMGVSYEDVRQMDEDAAYRMFYPDKFAVESMYAQPDYGYVHQELKRTGVTLKLLWQEYQDRCKTAGGIPVGYAKYCQDYSTYTVANKLTNHLEHKPGAAVEVDWSGPAMEYVDTATGEAVKAYLFVATLPYSQYSYVEPCLDMKMDSFIRAHVHMYQYFGSVATRLICDNLKTGVVSHPREGEIVLTADYEALGSHYQTAIMPAGIRKPKQKASVEGTVGKIATAVIASLRNEMFCSFEDLKAAVSKKLYAFNHNSFQKRDGSRCEAYLDEKPFLHPLPSIPYEIATWVYGRKVNIDFHVVFEYNRYSCPYQYACKTVDLKVTDSAVEIYSGNTRIATHNRFPSGRKNQYSTHQEDMPDKFRISPWDDVRIRNWAGAIGKYTAKVVSRIFDGVSIKEQGYNPALAVLRLSNKYSEARLEAACEFALTSGIKSPVTTILVPYWPPIKMKSTWNRRKSLKKQNHLWGICVAAVIMGVSGMINDETRRKLREMNLGEIVSGLEVQQSEPATLGLPFDDRIQRLVDYVYQEKYNAKIQRLIRSAKLRFPQADMQGILYEGRGLNKELLGNLSSCQYIDNRQSIVLQGFTGSGKTYLACALGKQACLNQFRALYIRLPDLLMEYGDCAAIIGSPKKLLKRYGKIPLLILDEWLVSDISDSELYFLFELMERRSDSASTIFCTQYRKDEWIKRLGEGVQAEAIVDRYAHTAYWIETGCMNMREYNAKEIKSIPVQ